MVGLQAEVVLRDAAAGLRTNVHHHHDHEARLLEVAARRRSGLAAVQEGVVLRARERGLHDHDEHRYLDDHHHPDGHEHHHHHDHGDPHPDQHDNHDDVFLRVRLRQGPLELDGRVGRGEDVLVLQAPAGRLHHEHDHRHEHHNHGHTNHDDKNGDDHNNYDLCDHHLNNQHWHYHDDNRYRHDDYNVNFEHNDDAPCVRLPDRLRGFGG
mmetsp:Transcript_17361/g.45937  ORF Transcript_17361/g.45937 Transcript_17361/m.45937 type:complete len:210 (-) Transcript_17361:523-1152(-)